MFCWPFFSVYTDKEFWILVKGALCDEFRSKLCLIHHARLICGHEITIYLSKSSSSTGQRVVSRPPRPIARMAPGIYPSYRAKKWYSQSSEPTHLITQNWRNSAASWQFWHFGQHYPAVNGTHLFNSNFTRLCKFHKLRYLAPTVTIY